MIINFQNLLRTSDTLNLDLSHKPHIKTIEDLAVQVRRHQEIESGYGLQIGAHFKKPIVSYFPFYKSTEIHTDFATERLWFKSSDGFIPYKFKYHNLKVILKNHTCSYISSPHIGNILHEYNQNPYTTYDNNDYISLKNAFTYQLSDSTRDSLLTYNLDKFISNCRFVPNWSSRIIPEIHGAERAIATIAGVDSGFVPLCHQQINDRAISALLDNPHNFTKDTFSRFMAYDENMTMSPLDIRGYTRGSDTVFSVDNPFYITGELIKIKDQSFNAIYTLADSCLFTDGHVEWIFPPNSGPIISNADVNNRFYKDVHKLDFIRMIESANPVVNFLTQYGLLENCRKVVFLKSYNDECLIHLYYDSNVPKIVYIDLALSPLLSTGYAASY